MELNIYPLISLVAIILLVKIGVIHIIGMGNLGVPIDAENRSTLNRLSGIILCVTAAWITLQLFQMSGGIEISETIYLSTLVALILFEIIYIIRIFSAYCHANSEAAKARRAKEEEAFAEMVKEVIKDEELDALEIEESAEATLERAKVVLDRESDLYRHIHTSFEAWIEAKGYLDQGITLQRIATEMKSNRTYLSEYINTTYNTTFRDWVTARRLDEAKQLLQQEPQATISDIALRIGFASAASFSRAFTRQEELSPAAWRANL